MEKNKLTRRETYGKVKEAIIEAHAAGMTYSEIETKSGFSRASLYNAARHLGLNLKPSKHRK